MKQISKIEEGKLSDAYYHKEKTLDGAIAQLSKLFKITDVRTVNSVHEILNDVYIGGQNSHRTW